MIFAGRPCPINQYHPKGPEMPLSMRLPQRAEFEPVRRNSRLHPGASLPLMVVEQNDVIFSTQGQAQPIFGLQSTIATDRKSICNRSLQILIHVAMHMDSAVAPNSVHE